MGHSGINRLVSLDKAQEGWDYWIWIWGLYLVEVIRRLKQRKCKIGIQSMLIPSRSFWSIVSIAASWRFDYNDNALGIVHMHTKSREQSISGAIFLSLPNLQW